MALSVTWPSAPLWFKSLPVRVRTCSQDKYKCPSPSASDMTCRIAALIRMGSSGLKFFAFTAMGSTVKKPNPGISHKRNGVSWMIRGAAFPKCSWICVTFLGVTPKGDNATISRRSVSLLWYPSRISTSFFFVIPLISNSLSGSFSRISKVFSL